MPPFRDPGAALSTCAACGALVPSRQVVYTTDGEHCEACAQRREAGELAQTIATRSRRARIAMVAQAVVIVAAMIAFTVWSLWPRDHRIRVRLRLSDCTLDPQLPCSVADPAADRPGGGL